MTGHSLTRSVGDCCEVIRRSGLRKTELLLWLSVQSDSVTHVGILENVKDWPGHHFWYHTPTDQAPTRLRIDMARSIYPTVLTTLVSEEAQAQRKHAVAEADIIDVEDAQARKRQTRDAAAQGLSREFFVSATFLPDEDKVYLVLDSIPGKLTGVRIVSASVDRHFIYNTRLADGVGALRWTVRVAGQLSNTTICNPRLIFVDFGPVGIPEGYFTGFATTMPEVVDQLRRGLVGMVTKAVGSQGIGPRFNRCVYLPRTSFDVVWDAANRLIHFVREETALTAQGIGTGSGYTLSTHGWVEVLTLQSPVTELQKLGAISLGFQLDEATPIFLPLVNDADGTRTDIYLDLQTDPNDFSSNIRISPREQWWPGELTLRSSLNLRSADQAGPTNVLGYLRGPDMDSSGEKSGVGRQWVLDNSESMDQGMRSLFGPLEMPTSIEFWLTAPGTPFTVAGLLEERDQLVVIVPEDPWTVRFMFQYTSSV